jgi:hypothetical protein
MRSKPTKVALRGTILVSLMSLFACSQPSLKQANDCRIEPGNKVDRVFSEVSGKLQNPACHYSYPEYRELLLAAAKGSPGADNEARFAGLLRESIDQGVISRRQGQALFSQYFDAEFYAVKAEPRSSCSSLREKEALYAAMREELAYKREGLLEILDDQARFRLAQQHYSDLHQVFDAVEVACTRAL